MASVNPRLHAAAYYVIFGLSGFAALVYESVWTHYLKLFLRHAAYAQSLVLILFMRGMAVGAWLTATPSGSHSHCWIRRRADSLAQPVLVLAFIQVLMGGLAIAAVGIYAQSFDAMAFGLKALQRNPEGYVFFNFYSHALCLAVMLPVTICAGMTLPLITQLLLREGLESPVSGGS